MAPKREVPVGGRGGRAPRPWRTSVTPNSLREARPVTKDEVRTALWGVIQANLSVLRFHKEPERRMLERILAVFGVERLKELPEEKYAEMVAFCAGVRWRFEGESDYERSLEEAWERRKPRNWGGRNWGRAENMRALRREIYEGAAFPGRCDLYKMSSNEEEVGRLFRVEHSEAGNLPQFPELHPGNDVPVVRIVENRHQLTMIRWGFAPPGKTPRCNNTRADEALGSMMWRYSFERRRCLVPATAFCLGTHTEPKKQVWFRVTDAEDGLFAFAGLWRCRRSPMGGRAPREFVSILTTTPNKLVASVHPECMPVIVKPADYDSYLRALPRRALALAKPYPAERMAIVEFNKAS